MNIEESPTCATCNIDDTLIHYFAACDLIVDFWASFSQCLSNMFNSFDTTHDKFIMIFGLEQTQKEINVMNYIFIMTQLFIYKNKLAKKRSIDFYKFLSFLKEKIHLKMSFHKIYCDTIKFNKKWGHLYDSQ